MKKISIRKIPAIVLSIAVVVSAFIPLSGFGTVTAQENGGDYYSVTAFTKDQLKNDGWVSTVTDPSTGAVTQNEDSIFAQGKKNEFWWKFNSDGSIQGQGDTDCENNFCKAYQSLTYTSRKFEATENFTLKLKTVGAYNSSAAISIGVQNAGDIISSENAVTIVTNPGNSVSTEDGNYTLFGIPFGSEYGKHKLPTNASNNTVEWEITVTGGRKLAVTANGETRYFDLNGKYIGGYVAFASRNSYTAFSNFSLEALASETQGNEYFAALTNISALEADGWKASYAVDPQRGNSFKDCKISDWLKIENGCIIRDDSKGSIGGLSWKDPFKEITALTYTAHKYKYFELSVDYMVGWPGAPWPIVTFGQENETAEIPYYPITATSDLADPTGSEKPIIVFPEEKGKLTIGGVPVNKNSASGPFGTGTSAQNTWHNLTITVTQDRVTAVIDKNVVEVSTPLSGYTGGYIALMLGKSYSRFKNLHITEIEYDSFTENVNVADGSESWMPENSDKYFVPYGGATDENGNILEKNYDGSFNVKGKANINVTYFKKPESGKITTFGTSFKLAEDIKDGGIQFGSYTEDTANKEFYTLIIRGKDESTVAALTDEQKQNMVNAYLNWNTGLQDVWGSYADGTETYEIKVIKQRKYMWKDAAENNTVLQYAIRLYGDFASGNNSEVKFSAIGFSKSGDEISFANAFKTAAYGDYAKQFTVSDGVGKVDFVTLCNLGYVKTVGRAGVVEDESGKSFVTAYTNSGFEISGNLTGDIWLTSDTTDKAPATRGNNFITVILDGEYKGTYWRGGAGCRDNLKLNLDGGYHTVRVERANKVGDGNMRITSIEFNGTLKRPQTNAGALNIEVLGDSISEGIGTGTSSDKAWDSAGGGDNAYYSYAAVMGRELNANLSVVAYAGKAIKEVREECYPYIGHGGVGNYNFSAANQKDVVVINLGTNGAYNVETRGNDTDNDIKNEAIALMTEVRKNNPNAYIIWVYGMMAPNQEHFAAYEDAVLAMNDRKIIAYKIGEKNSFTGHGYDNYHPSKDEHAQYGKELAEYIKTLNIK